MPKKKATTPGTRYLVLQEVINDPTRVGWEEVREVEASDPDSACKAVAATLEDQSGHYWAVPARSATPANRLWIEAKQETVLKFTKDKAATEAPKPAATEGKD